MRIGPYELAANVSLLFTEVELPERFELARSAGFTAAECWWPFSTAAPPRTEIDALLSAADRSGVDLIGMNFFAGDMAGGERGVLSHPDRTNEFLDSLAVISTVANETGCRTFNALYGQRIEGASGADQDAVAIQNLAIAQAELETRSATIVLEALSVPENGDYPLTSCAEIDEILRKSAAVSPYRSLKILFDTYHLASNGENLIDSIDKFAGLIGHVQLADAPGRGEPGSGFIDFPNLIKHLGESGYSGTVAAEYRPISTTADGLGWIRDLDKRIEQL